MINCGTGGGTANTVISGACNDGGSGQAPTTATLYSDATLTTQLATGTVTGGTAYSITWTPTTAGSLAPCMSP